MAACQSKTAARRGQRRRRPLQWWQPTGLSLGAVALRRVRGRDLHPDLLGGLWLGPEVQRTIARQQVTGNLLHHHHHLSLSRPAFPGLSGTAGAGFSAFTGTGRVPGLRIGAQRGGLGLPRHRVSALGPDQQNDGHPQARRSSFGPLLPTPRRSCFPEAFGPLLPTPWQKVMLRPTSPHAQAAGHTSAH